MDQEPRDRETDAASRARVTRADGLEARAAAGAADGAHPSDRRAWTDPQLIAAVRDERSDTAALDALVARHWKGLHARCALLTLSGEAASDLAQETWLRMLRARHALDPDGNLAGYLATIATNLWRDRNRSERRAGPLADRRLASLDAPTPDASPDAPAFADALPDPVALSRTEQAMLKLDLDRALGRLSPRSREVLIARYLDGESAAEIGARHGRTEQTITAWVRQAVREIGQYLDTSSPNVTRTARGA
jgi:RNA polymerase sigma-70 factor, ECF subfamily